MVEHAFSCEFSKASALPIRLDFDVYAFGFKRKFWRGGRRFQAHIAAVAANSALCRGHCLRNIFAQHKGNH